MSWTLVDYANITNMAIKTLERAKAKVSAPENVSPHGHYAQACLKQ
jgi:hypothetical protein